MQPVALILVSVGMSVVGQVLLKAGVMRLGSLALGGTRTASTALRIMGNPIIWSGLGVYVLGTFFWLAALSRVELGYAYPFLSLSYVLVMVTSWIALREEVSGLRVAGVAVICCGVYAVAGG
jgi:drug/metabolite transporter (DMT)-like permease